LSTNTKFVRKNSRLDEDHYDNDLFSTLVGAWKLFLTYNTTDTYKYLRSPAGLLMALNPIGVKIDFSDGAEYPELLSHEVYNALINNRIEEIEDKLTVEEKIYLNYIATQKFTPPREKILRTFCIDRGIDVQECIDTWRIQPETTAIAHALASKRARLEGITPVVGIPLKMVVPSTDVGKIRFPGVVTKYHKNKIHVHKDGELFEIYDMTGKKLDVLPHSLVSPPDSGMSYVLEGFIEDDEFIAVDILCWNDIWLFRRPLAERIKLLWHFFDFTEETFIVRNRNELNKVKDELNIVNFRNLNAKYDPTAYDGAIKLEGDIETVILKVSGRRGGRTKSYLITNDRKVVFEVPVEIEREDRGDVVEVKRDGTVLQILEKEQIPDSWIELTNKWDYPLNYDDYGKDRVIPKCTWPGDDRK
jgi:hypothetical protein